MGIKITRRDFLNGILLGAGASLLEMSSPLLLMAQKPQWNGYGGTGDYRDSNGNTESVVTSAHKLRDGSYRITNASGTDTGEFFDLVIIGGGISGLAAAFQFKQNARSGQKCLIIENHPIFGGESRRNEFSVNGQKLIGPQGANSFEVIDDPDVPGYDIYSELGIPGNFSYQKFTGGDKKLQFDRTNFGFMLWHDSSPSFGYYFSEKKEGWASDIWKNRLTNTPYSEKVRKDFQIWRESGERHYDGNDFKRWLDTMTYRDYLEKVMKLSPEITKFADPVLAAGIGLGADVISAFGAYQVLMPGFEGFRQAAAGHSAESDWHSFPGGNDGIARHFVKKIIPNAIMGGRSFADIHNRSINFEALDSKENVVRMRLGALAVDIEHDREPGKSEYVRVVYVKGDKVMSIKARTVVMAGGSWVTRRIVKGLPAEYQNAYSQFYRSPALVVNVALTNWKFLYKLGLTACRWFDGFGFSCNIRRPMIVGDYRPPLDPEKPVILTFYVPFYYPGHSIKDQGVKGRLEMLSTGFADYEKKILAQMKMLFGTAGFDPEKDVAGIILNRWGHAYVNPQPGFYFGRNGSPAPSSIIRKPFGRISFAHSELGGHQHWLGAAFEGRRAARQTMDLL